MLWGAVTMRRAKTNMAAEPRRRPARRLGAFAISRHPIYVGGAIAFLGLGVAASHAWICLAALVVARAIERFGIAREEAHLAARFGDAWTRYAARTPRWLGPGSLRFGGARPSLSERRSSRSSRRRSACNASRRYITRTPA